MTPALQIIRSLVESFIDHPTQLRIETTPHPGVLYWLMQFHADDHSKAVGKRGAHYDALKLLIAEIGRANDTQYVLRRYREPEPTDRSENMRRGCPEEYDPTRATHILTGLLEHLHLGDFQVHANQVAGEHPLSFGFTIHTRTALDYKALTVPREDNALPMTLVGAIGTLFRAYGNRNGVKFTVEVTTTA